MVWHEGKNGLVEIQPVKRLEFGEEVCATSIFYDCFTGQKNTVNKSLIRAKILIIPAKPVFTVECIIAQQALFF